VEISRGKNCCPVISAAFAAGIEASTCEPSRACTGLNPRNAANTDPTGGSPAARSAASAGTPAACSPESSVPGKERASPAISSEKNTPIDKTVPADMNVEPIPAAAPRSEAGTLLITEAVFGAENSPEPAPFNAISSANAQYEKSIGSVSRPTKVTATSTSPPVDRIRAPCRSDSRPASGPAARKPPVSGSR
jgi:hypothetical protein